jgi:hypothetical protein
LIASRQSRNARERDTKFVKEGNGKFFLVFILPDPQEQSASVMCQG